MYTIAEQQDGKEVVMIKAITKCLTNDKSFFRLKSAVTNRETGKRNDLPCLRVVLTNGSTDHRFEVRWSNYYEQNGMDSGKFKLVRVDTGKPVFLLMKDINNRTVVDKRTGKPVIDFTAMAMRFGSEPVWSDDTRPVILGWEFGKNQPFEEHQELMFECETLDKTYDKLCRRFGSELSNEILELFITHKVFAEFVS
jgi:hypothetical protein